MEDGWNGSYEQPSITVQGGSFEHAKSEMEMPWGSTLRFLDAQPGHRAQVRLRKDDRSEAVGLIA